MPSYMNDTELLNGLKAGEEAAFDHIYTAYRKWLWIAALGILQNETEAEEIVQEFFIDFWQVQAEKDFTDINHLKKYLFVSIRNRCINKLESNKVKKRRYERMNLPQGFTLPANRLEQNELQRLLNDAIGKLPPVRSKVFRMGYLFQRSRKEIANALNISEESVKKHMMLALKDLRVSLKNHDNH